MDIRERLLAAFLAEHKEYLEGIRSTLNRWRKPAVPERMKTWKKPFAWRTA